MQIVHLMDMCNNLLGKGSAYPFKKPDSHSTMVMQAAAVGHTDISAWLEEITVDYDEVLLYAFFFYTLHLLRSCHK